MIIIICDLEPTPEDVRLLEEIRLKKLITSTHMQGI